MRVFVPLLARRSLRVGGFLLVASLAGCATITSATREDGMSVAFTGTADGAAMLLRATDARPYDLADKAVDKGMTISLEREDVRFRAGYPPSYGWTGYGYGQPGVVGGYPSDGNVVYVPGRGLVPVGPLVGGLPPLARTVAAPALESGGIVPCPPDREPRTVAEQAACAALSAERAILEATKKKK